MLKKNPTLTFVFPELCKNQFDVVVFLFKTSNVIANQDFMNNFKEKDFGENIFLV